MVIILSESAGFPNGMAASSRVKLLGKGLISQGNEVLYIGLRGVGTNRFSWKGKEGGVKYVYPHFITKRSNFWIFRRLDDFFGNISTFLLLCILRVFSNTIILYTRNYKVVNLWVLFLKPLGYKIILELCEWPLVNNYYDKASIQNAEKFCKTSILKVNAILPISNYIEKKVQILAKEKNKVIPTFKIPILTDVLVENIEVISKENNDSLLFLLYSGSVEYIEIAYFVVDIIYYLHQQQNKMSLVFTGGGNKQIALKIKEYAQIKGLSDFIKFTGYLSEVDLLKKTSEAFCLLAPMPVTEQSEARFPTKIGFYLSTGRPIITNLVGSLTEYLINDQNAIVVKDFKPEFYANKISELIDDKEFAKRVGNNGKILANEKFYYKNATNGLTQFIKSL